jgi:hypothetical protein
LKGLIRFAKEPVGGEDEQHVDLRFL